MESVAFVGLGGMGSGMARRLSAVTDMRVFDLSSSRCEAIASTRVAIAASARDTVVPGGVLITMLPDDRAVHSIVTGADGVAAALGEGGLHINMSTVSPNAAKALNDTYAGTGGQFVSAPVWGRPESAASGELVCALAGKLDAKRRARPFLDVLAQRVEDLGPEPQHANIAKLAGNFMVAAAIESLAEGLAMADKHGVDRHALAALLTETVFNCPAYQMYGPKVADQQCPEVGFTVTLGRKDLRLIRETAMEVDVPMPVADVIENHLTTAAARGLQDEDWSAMSWVTFEEAGIPRKVR